MQISDYQKQAAEFTLPRSKNLTYMVCGLCSEAGEIAGKFKKVIRGDTKWDDKAIAAELGDVAWYLSGIATQCGLSLETILRDNITKLESRQMRGKLNGDGDNR
jgi:NTP pyrophosphatase (non-canonical NTP hydrolase)